MSASDTSILLIGESGVGKTHYGAQLLKRLMKGDGLLRMNGAATNLEPFEAAMDSLNEGMAAHHTPITTYADSVWPIIDVEGRNAQLVWPDYGGEQVKAMSAKRRVPAAWRERIIAAPMWLLLLRLQQSRISDDILSRPLSELKGSGCDNRELQVSDQARLIELMQMLVYIRGATSLEPLHSPLCVLLSCWDELGIDDVPATVLAQRLPMLSSYLTSTWADPSILGLSALERPLTPVGCDDGYAARGPEQFGYVVLADGTRSTDLTLPIQLLLEKIF